MFYRFLLIGHLLIINNFGIFNDSVNQLVTNHYRNKSLDYSYLFGDFNYHFSDIFWGRLSQACLLTELRIILPEWKNFADNWTSFTKQYSNFGFDQTSFLMIETKNVSKKLNKINIATNQISNNRDQNFQFFFNDYDDTGFFGMHYDIEIGLLIVHDDNNIYLQLYFNQYSLFVNQNMKVAINLDSYYFS